MAWVGLAFGIGRQFAHKGVVKIQFRHGMVAACCGARIVTDQTALASLTRAFAATRCDDSAGSKMHSSLSDLTLIYCG
ncbi:MAG: hypothetical protein Tsb0027_11080 [Wenzhouxiangellaceae bacterium]